MNIEGTCRACGARMLWAIMPSGRANPLNAEEVPAELGKGIIALNPRTGHGMPVTYAVIENCPAWSEAGISFHTSHFATCPERRQFKREPASPASGQAAA